MNGKPEWKCRWGRLRKFLNARLSSLNFFPTKKKGGIEDWQHYQSTKEDWCSNRVHPWRKKCLKVGSHIQHEDADNHYKPLWHSTETGHKGDFPGGSMVENLPSNAGDMGSISGGGTKIPHAAGQLSPCATATEPPPLKEREACVTLLRPCPSTRKKPMHHNCWACAPQEKPVCHDKDPIQPKINNF